VLIGAVLEPCIGVSDVNPMRDISGYRGQHPRWNGEEGSTRRFDQLQAAGCRLSVEGDGHHAVDNAAKTTTVGSRQRTGIAWASMALAPSTAAYIIPPANIEGKNADSN
jgi:hypothetical protein